MSVIFQKEELAEYKMKTCNNCGKHHNNGKCPKCGSRNATTWKDESVPEKKDKYINKPFPHITK